MPFGVEKAALLGAAGAGGLELSGGTESSSGGYNYYTFNSTATLTVTGEGEVDLLLVAGGGGGGGQASWATSGAGGAGGYRTKDAITIYEGTYTCTVGAGGAAGLDDARGSKGVNSSIAQASGSGWSTLTTTGGGGGGYAMSPSAVTGGSASGTANYSNNWTGAGATGNEGGYTPVEGYDSNSSTVDEVSGGAGATEDGSNAAVGYETWGGDGDTWYDSVARGGGGGKFNDTSHGYLFGGGGNGRDAGSANTGGGGVSSTGGQTNSGGSGCIVFRVAA